MASHDSAPRAPKTWAEQIRRWVVIVIIVSFSIAAVAGIIVLLGDINSDPAYKVLATTALIGVFSIAVFCGAVLIGKPWQWFGWLTTVLSVATVIRLLWLVWVEPDWSDDSMKITITMCVLTAATAVASLLLLLVAHRRPAVRIALFVTLALIAAGVIMTLLPLWGIEPDDTDSYMRAMGIVWILAALGVVVLPVMSLILRAQPTPHRLSVATLQRIEAAAHTAGVTPDELIDRLIPPN